LFSIIVCLHVCVQYIAWKGRPRNVMSGTQNAEIEKETIILSEKRSAISNQFYPQHQHSEV